MTAYLYTWGEGRVTSEGESIAVRTEELEIGYIDGMLCVLIPQRCLLQHALHCSPALMHDRSAGSVCEHTSQKCRDSCQHFCQAWAAVGITLLQQLVPGR